MHRLVIAVGARINTAWLRGWTAGRLGGWDAMLRSPLQANAPAPGIAASKDRTARCSRPLHQGAHELIDWLLVLPMTRNDSGITEPNARHTALGMNTRHR